MSDGLRPLRVNALELLRQPGAERPVRASIPGDDLGVEHAALRGDVDVDVDVRSTLDAIDVTGTVSAAFGTVCRRCLAEVRGTAVSEVEERYRLDDVDAEAYPIENGQLDLVPMVRESILLELDAERLCGEACAGLCPVCGVDRNVETCDCDTSVRDERWSALDGLVLDDG